MRENSALVYRDCKDTRAQEGWELMGWSKEKTVAPDLGFSETLDFSCWKQDRIGFKPIIAKAGRTYMKQNSAPSLQWWQI